MDRSICVRRSIEVDAEILVPLAALSAARLDSPVQLDVAGKPHDNQLAVKSGRPVSVSIAQSPAAGCPKPCSADSGELSAEVAPTELSAPAGMTTHGGNPPGPASDERALAAPPCRRSLIGEIGEGGDHRALQVGPNLATGNPRGDAVRREITSWTR